MTAYGCTTGFDRLTHTGYSMGYIHDTMRAMYKSRRLLYDVMGMTRPPTNTM